MPNDALKPGETTCPRLERLDRDREGPTPFAECREFIEALRTRVGVPARDSLPEGLSEGVGVPLDEGEAWREDSFKGSGVDGVEGNPGDRGPGVSDSDSWLSDCASSLLEAGAAARRGGAALGGDAIESCAPVWYNRVGCSEATCARNTPKKAEEAQEEAQEEVALVLVLRVWVELQRREKGE